MAELDYKKDIQIDPDSLDIELIRQPQLISGYSEQLAQAQREVNKAEEVVKTLRSKFIRDANKNPEETVQSSKATGQLIEAYYRSQPEYQKAKTNLHDVEYERDILQGIVSGLRQKKDALEGLIKLASMNYFSTPNVPRDLKGKWQEYNQIAKKEGEEKIKERRRSRK